MNDDQPHVEKKKSWRDRLPDNWYRDVWLVVITAIVFVALANIEKEQTRGDKERNDLVQVTDQLCAVVINVHEGAIARVHTERNRLHQTRNYLRTLTPEERVNQKDLIKRVRENLPSVISDVKIAKQQEAATKPPSDCSVKEPPTASRTGWWRFTMLVSE